MSGADRLEDGFPHSTPEGYRSGCQGRACPGVADNGISCADSFARYQGDYGFRKKVDAGMTPKEIVAAERAATTVAAPKPRPVKKPTVQPLSEEAQAAIDAAAVETVEAAPAEAPAKEIPIEKHGTPKGYYLGCRLKDECPGIERVGKSCNQAVNEYQRTVKENRKKREAAAAAAAGGADEVLPATAVEAVVEHELVGVGADGELCSCGEREGSVVEHLAAVALALPSPADQEPEEPTENGEAAPDELTTLRDRVAELERLLAEASKAQPAEVTTLPDGTRVTVVVTVERAA